MLNSNLIPDAMWEAEDFSICYFEQNSSDAYLFFEPLDDMEFWEKFDQYVATGQAAGHYQMMIDQNLQTLQMSVDRCYPLNNYTPWPVLNKQLE